MDSKFEMRKEMRDIIRVCSAIRKDILSSPNGKIEYGNENYANWKTLVDNFTQKYRIREKHNSAYNILAQYWYKRQSWTLDINEIENISSALTEIKNAEGLEWYDKIFISHCERDANSVHLFVELLNKIGISIPFEGSEKSIFFSSHKAYNIKVGERNKTRIKQELKARDKNTLYILWYTPNYFDSIACLNEMGAIWILDKPYCQILMPNFDSQNIGGLLSEEPTWIRADDAAGLNDLKNLLLDKFLLPNLDENYWETSRNEYIQRLHDELNVE